ncbi:hypothetical protein L484_006973 [Morus notabilis]|uniref:TF-B3 domain-containing protein n=1 Tax=Morus notabilis TaxID=981085 RepID=W9RRB7_9ROSA|nr:hypothetical protein L484_006973 [Morus notabilis]
MALFSKSLCHFDITQKFIVPIDWLGSLLPSIEQNSEATISVVGQNGSEHAFVLRTRKIKDDQPYLKPVFQNRGWLQFVRADRLRVDETVYFWKERRGNEDIIRVQVRDRPNIHVLMGFAIEFK